MIRVINVSAGTEKMKAVKIIGRAKLAIIDDKTNSEMIIINTLIKISDRTNNNYLIREFGIKEVNGARYVDVTMCEYMAREALRLIEKYIVENNIDMQTPAHSYYNKTIEDNKASTNTTDTPDKNNDW